MQTNLFSTSRAYSVSEITARIRALLEQEPTFRDVWVEGEVSNFSRAPSGHIYFTLKDAGAQLHCVIWKSAVRNFATMVHTGDQVAVHGRMSLYDQGGQYQLHVDAAQPAGRGALYQEYERLKARLEAEGLFDPARKRPHNRYPKVIGVVTSPQAAAFQDVCNVLRRRYPLARVLLAPTAVQGEAAPPQIVAALAQLNARPEVDVILVVRGGGSLEDLWAFNDERVARAVAASRAPVISGVGHETDFSLTDFAADLRAPTPSAAAEQATADIEELRSQVRERQRRLRRAFARQQESARRRVTQAARALRHLAPSVRLANARQRVDDLFDRAQAAVGHRLRAARERLGGLSGRLAALNPEAVLLRGYAIIYARPEGTLLTAARQMAPGQALTVRFSDGEVAAQVEPDAP